MEERLRYLFKRYVENKCSQKELEEFFGYIHRSGHEVELRQLIRTVYEELKENPSLSTYVDEKGRLVLTEPSWITSTPAISTGKKQGVVSRLLFAASIILVAGLLWFFNDRKQSPNSFPVSSLTRKATDRSESKFLILADSTKVWLNAASSLDFPDQFGASKREVYLTGEAFFDVKHADKIPFIIHTGDVSTTVLGTAFNIKAYPGQKSITVSVSRGKVRVARNDGWQTTLTMGQQVKVEEERKAITERTVALTEVAAWQQGDIIFDDELLADIIADMQRIYNATIEVNDASLKGLRISTSFRKEIGLEQALQVLCRLTESELKQANGIYIIQ